MTHLLQYVSSRLYSVCLIATTSLTAFAVEPADTTYVSLAAKADSIPISHELDEVVVEGRTQRIVKYGVQYTPDKRSKKMAYDAVSLLRHINIPQLNISGQNITTITGQKVAIFIDYVSATSDDLKGLRPEDVLYVEVLQYPEDPRFMGQQYVVNYIMHKYEWGGYTKLTGTGTTLSYNGYNAHLYSKFVYKRMTFDASAGAGYYHLNKEGGKTSEIFRDFMFDNRQISELTRITTSGDRNISLTNSQWASFRAQYNTENTVILHLLGFNREGNPVKRLISDVTFSEPILPSTQSVSKEKSQSISPSISAYYYFKLPKNNTLNVRWSFAYGSTRRNSSYTLTGLTPIINDNKEQSYSPNATVSYGKSFSHNNSFHTSLMTYNTIYHTNYMGSYTDLQKLLSSENMLFLEYMQNWVCGINLYARVGSSYVVGRVNGENTLKQWNPRLGFQLQYNINQIHQASIEGWWGNSHPHPSSANSALIQTDELMWKMGNPDLKNTIFQEATATYSFIPTNTFSLSAAFQYEGEPDKQSTEYLVMPGHNGLVQRQINSGSFRSYMAFLSGTVKLFDNALSLKGNIKAGRLTLSGIDAQSLNQIVFACNVNYYFKNFAFTLHYSSPDKILHAWTNGKVYTGKNKYGINVSYAMGNIRAILNFNNWFNSGNTSNKFESPHYSVYAWQWDNNYSRSIDLSVVYTLPYGNKVTRDNELGAQRGVGSAILK